MRPVMSILAEKHRNKIGPVLFFLSLALYVLTLSRYVAPGNFAKIVVQHIGLTPFPPLSRFLWGWTANIVAAVLPGPVSFKLNLMSAFCGAASVWLMYVLVSRIPRDRTAEENEARFPMEELQVLSGIVAAVFMAVCTPFWVVSNRAYPATFDVLLLLLTAWVTVRFLETKNLKWGCLSALLFGLGLTQFSTFILFAPVYVLLMAFILWRSGLFRARHILLVLFCGLAGLTPYFVGALQYMWSPAFEWRQFGTYWKVLWFVWREQYMELRFSVPHVGWLLVFMVNVLPWLVIVVFPKRAMTRSAVLGSQFLHVLLGLLAIAVLFNVPIAPWPLLGTRTLLVMPYVLTAMWAGYIAGYWYLFFYQQSRFEIKGRFKIRPLGRPIYLPLMAIILVGAAAWNVREADGRAADVAAKFAEEVLENLDGRNWLISNGVVDDLIAISAAEKQIPLQLVNASQASGAYLKYLGSLFQDPRLRGLAQVGLQPLLAEWFVTDPEVPRKVAILGISDLWMAEGLLPVPYRVMFFGAQNTDDIDADEYFRKNRELWDGLGMQIATAAGRPGPSHPWVQWIQTHVSKVANNAGVLLEDLQRRDLAFEAYASARRLDSNNISALLNMLDIAHAESRPEKEALDKEFEGFVEKMRTRLRLWSLAQHYGYVRRPEAFASLGWAWAISGKAGAGMREIQRAAAAGANRKQVEHAMAALYVMQRMDAQGEQSYLALLEENPRDARAVLGLLRIAVRKGDVRLAAQYLGRLRDIGAPEEMVAMEEAGIELLDGNTAIAEEILLRVVKQNPKNLRAWSILSLISETKKVREEAEATLASAAARSPEVLLVMAYAAANRRDVRSARSHLEQLLRMQPASIPAMEAMLSLDVMESRRDLAEEHLEQLLRIDPRNAFANYVLGTIQYARGELVLAEASYRVSVETNPTGEALNDLAWILQRKGQAEEALPLIQRSLEMNENNAAAWDTLGVVLLQLNRLNEAKEALEKALALRPGAAATILHMAQLYESMGMVSEARQLADPLLARPSEMSPDSYDDLRRLLERLRAAGGTR